jgi:hypothetical protein
MSEVCDGLSGQIFNLQWPAITDRDVRSDSRQVFSSSPQPLPLDIVPYLSIMTFDPQIERSEENARFTPLATTESPSDIRLDRTQLDPSFQTRSQISTLPLSSLKVCELCGESFNSSEQLW